MRGYLWATEFLVFSDFLVASPHVHSAMQLHVGLDGAPRVQLGGDWHTPRGALINTDTVHAFDCAGCTTAIGWIEVESQIGRELRARVLEGRPYAVLDADLCDAIASEIGPAREQETECADAYRRWRSSLAKFGIDVDRDRPPDARIAAVLDHLRTTPWPPPSIDDLTRLAHLSESRLQHVFREQVGVPIRRYLLWHRYLTALRLLAEGRSATEAAHAAGFSDSAHLTRTAVQLNGFTPTKMPFKFWLSNC